MADQVMVTMPQREWNMMMFGAVAPKLLFPNQAMWKTLCAQIYRRHGTMVFMAAKTATMIIILHVLTNRELDYLQGKQNKARQGKANGRRRVSKDG